MENKISRSTLFLLVIIVCTLAGIVGYLNVKITTFEECEKAGWLVRNITVYEGYGPFEKECILWTGKSFAKQRERSEPVFDNDTELNNPCSVDSDCILPSSYFIRSDCPYEMKCIENKCTVICPPFEKSPVVFFPAQSAPSQYFPGQAFDEAADILTKKWDPENFKGFWRDSETGASTETLVINQSILNNSYRVIEKHNLIYTTKPVPFKYQVYARANVTPPGTDGSYSAVGWQGERDIMLDKNRLARVIFEQNASDVKIITTGYLWAFQEGYKLLAHSIEAPLEREAWIEFLNGTNKLDEQVLPDRYLYIYPSGASEIPIFITYISSIHRSPYEDLGEFKYTWLRSQNITEIREGKIFDSMEVISVKNGTIELRNKNPIVLSSGNTVHLMGDISIQVENSETGLVFYPIKWGNR